MKKDKEKKNKTNSYEAFIDSIKEEVTQFFSEQRGQSFTFNQLVKSLAINDRKTKMVISDLLDTLEEERKLVRLPNGSYTADAETLHFVGRLEHINARFAFVVTEESEQDIWVDAENLKTAIDGDLVKVSVYTGGKGRRLEGEIVEVLERKRDEFVGRIEILSKYAFVIPDGRRLFSDIFIPLDHVKEAKHGDKVIVKITQWGEGDRKSEGIVTKVLGRAGANETEMHAILAEFGLPIEFPEEISHEAEKISSKITKEEISKRRDFRKVTTFTIDPADAKDFDDALSIQKLENGNWEIGVHIADVTHYVKPNTKLENEAYKRATSVYLVDRTVPMLPEKLSNELCSLRPHEDKLTFSAVFELTEEGHVAKEWFGRTIIHSDHRFAYEEAQVVIEARDGIYAEELTLLNSIALKLRDERFRKGAISFETVEVKFQLDERGAPLAVFPRIRKDAHKLIEEYMLLANKKVAEYIYKMKKGEHKNTMVYRIHEKPDLDKLTTFSTFVKRFGYDLRVDEKGVAASLNHLIDSIEGTPEQNVLQSLAIRTMAKARYSTAELGHFGLAFAHYSHFTSPIRRYPDMMAHRLLQHYLDGGESVDKEEYEGKCKHSSEMEKLAADAERASIKYKQVEFMRGFEDKEFDGIITGVTEFGIFVEIIETRCEGMIRMSDLTDDFYELDKENYRVVGTRKGKVLSFGDTVKVKVKDTNLDKRSMDLFLVGQKAARERNFREDGRDKRGRVRSSDKSKSKQGASAKASPKKGRERRK